MGYFVDDITGTLNAVTVQSKCGSQLYAIRTDPGFTSAVNEARLALNVDNPFLLEESQQECRVDPIVPNVTFFDQVHLDTGYASDNPDVQSNHTGMDEAAALLANRTDCEYDSELNFDALLLGGYFCHVCLPEQDLTCAGGGSCTNIQWTGYICDNEFQIVDNPNPALPVSSSISKTKCVCRCCKKFVIGTVIRSVPHRPVVTPPTRGRVIVTELQSVGIRVEKQAIITGMQ